MDTSFNLSEVQNFCLDMLRDSLRTPKYVWTVYRIPKQLRKLPLHRKLSGAGIYSWYAIFTTGVLCRAGKTTRPFKGSYHGLQHTLHEMPDETFTTLWKGLEECITAEDKTKIRNSYWNSREHSRHDTLQFRSRSLFQLEASQPGPRESSATIAPNHSYYPSRDEQYPISPLILQGTQRESMPQSIWVERQQTTPSVVLREASPRVPSLKTALSYMPAPEPLRRAFISAVCSYLSAFKQSPEEERDISASLDFGGFFERSYPLPNTLSRRRALHDEVLLKENLAPVEAVERIMPGFYLRTLVVFRLPTELLAAGVAIQCVDFGDPHNNWCQLSLSISCNYIQFMVRKLFDLELVPSSDKWEVCSGGRRTPLEENAIFNVCLVNSIREVFGEVIWIMVSCSIGFKRHRDGMGRDCTDCVSMSVRPETSCPAVVGLGVDTSVGMQLNECLYPSLRSSSNRYAE